MFGLIGKKELFYDYEKHHQDGDVFLASYPRSGNTWTRHILSAVFFPKNKIDSLLDLQKTIPDIHYNRSYIKPLSIGSGVRIIKTHHVYNPKYKKVIYIYRNPIDVAWSSYRFITDTQTGSFLSLDHFVDEFLKGNVFFGEWDVHATRYNQNTEKILFVSYEEMIHDIFSSIKKMVDFVGLPKPDELIKHAIENSTPDKISHIANDEFFYSGKIPSFVNSPLGKLTDDKNVFIEKFKNIFVDHYKTYDFMNKKIIF